MNFWNDAPRKEPSRSGNQPHCKVTCKKMRKNVICAFQNYLNYGNINLIILNGGEKE